MSEDWIYHGIHSYFTYIFKQQTTSKGAPQKPIPSPLIHIHHRNHEGMTSHGPRPKSMTSHLRTRGMRGRTQRPQRACSAAYDFSSVGDLTETKKNHTEMLRRKTLIFAFVFEI